MVPGPLHRFLSSQTLSVTRASFSSAAVFGAYYARPRLPSCRMLQDSFRDEIPANMTASPEKHPKQTVTRASAFTLLSYAQHSNFPKSDADLQLEQRTVVGRDFPSPPTSTELKQQKFVLASGAPRTVSSKCETFERLLAIHPIKYSDSSTIICVSNRCRRFAVGQTE
ncbi:uncharacterized protein CLUP02_02459 [Colletotrichum lupini]|uniref:Uncharacterized protein n=1 Tax=Colletotrichum lupini TaxID=145971 RepID=A0A9Q8SH45_9PEZI|nr:uncharacterized protein CLUP02_02459 [Colletotrichum lupini]UQC76993.1 hypothetical protein CLUP02_02459 [Colletotrichum lupini]